MTDKLGAVKAKAAKALKGLLWIRWPLVFVLGCVLLVFAGGASVVAFYPLQNHRGQIENLISRSLGADKVSLKKLEWAYSLLDLSVGVKLVDLQVDGAKQLETASISSASASLQPWKIFFAKIPVKIVLKGKKALVHSTFAAPEAKGSPDKESANLGAAHPVTFPKWFSYLRVQMEADFEEISCDPKDFGFTQESVLLVKNPRLSAVLSGLPGHFELKMSSSLGVDLVKPELSARGPIETHLKGYFQTESGRIVGVRVEDLSLDLGHATITGLGMLEKPSNIPLSFSSELQVILDSAGQTKSIEFPGAKLIYDKIHVDLSGQAEEARHVSFRWAVAKMEVEGLRLPVSNLRNVPLKGVLETSGAMEFGTSGLGSGSWRVAFNNIIFNTSDIPSDSGVTKGSLKVSFMSEGTIDGGQITSPRTEIQIDGTDAEMNLWKGRLQKPIGRTFEGIAKLKIEDDKLSIREFKGSFFTTQFEGSGYLEDLTRYLAGDPVKFSLSLSTNRVDISKYAIFLPMFRRPPPLEGFFEFSGAVEGQVKRDDWDTDRWSWRLDQLNLSNFKVIVDNESIVQFGMGGNDFSFHGPLTASLLMKGRGRGSVVSKGLLMGQIDATDAAIRYRDTIKPVRTPFFLDISLEQARQSLKIRRGEAKFHEIDLAFDGNLVQGSSKSYIDLRMAHPFKLSRLRSFFQKPEDPEVDGLVTWKGRLGFKSPGTMETNFDWKTLSVEGELAAADLVGRIGSLRGALKGGKFKVLMSPDSLTLENFSGRVGGAQVFASGKIDLNDTDIKGTKGNIAKLLSQENWDVSAAVSVSHLSSDDFAVVEAPKKKNEAENIKNAVLPTDQLIKSFLDLSMVKKNQMNLSLRAGSGEWKGFAFKDLNARFLWRNNAFQAQPMSVGVFGGTAQGSLSWDANPYYSRKDVPKISGSFKARDMDLKKTAQYFKPDMAPLVGGKFQGELTLAGQGFGPDEIMGTIHGRMSGHVKEGSFETLQALKGSIDSLISNSAARDYLNRQASREACVQKQFTGDLDLQLEEGGAILFQKTNFAFESGSRVSLHGKLDRDLKADLTGVFAAGPKCISGGARACLAETPGGAALLPFRIQGSASHPKISADVDTLGRRVASCMASGVSHQVEKVIEEKTGMKPREELKKVEDKALDALKGLIKSN